MIRNKGFLKGQQCWVWISIGVRLRRQRKTTTNLRLPHSAPIFELHTRRYNYNCVMQPQSKETTATCVGNFVFGTKTNCRLALKGKLETHYILETLTVSLGVRQLHTPVACTSVHTTNLLQYTSITRNQHNKLCKLRVNFFSTDGRTDT